MKKINNILNKLRLMGVTAVKQSTEDEGSSFNDILLMRKITKKNKLKDVKQEMISFFVKEPKLIQL